MGTRDMGWVLTTPLKTQGGKAGPAWSHSWRGRVSPRGFLSSPGVKPDLPVAVSGGSAQLLHLPRATEVISILEVWVEMLGGTCNEIPSFLPELLLR